jgi:2-hydroxychromene-2-carboxylate isomerase
MHRNYVLDEDINSPAAMEAVLEDLELDSRSILASAQTEEIKTALRERTEEARTRGIFGAPTFFVGNEMFWGNDRLEDALAAAIDVPKL